MKKLYNVINKNKKKPWHKIGIGIGIGMGLKHEEHVSMR
jgi:hypothetical protein